MESFLCLNVQKSSGTFFKSESRYKSRKSKWLVPRPGRKPSDVLGRLGGSMSRMEKRYQVSEIETTWEDPVIFSFFPFREETEN